MRATKHKISCLCSSYFLYTVPMPHIVDSFLEAVLQERSLDATICTWPLTPPQINPYFEAEQALDIYDILNSLKNTKSKKEVSALFGYPAVLRSFMLNAGVIGLKTAKKANLREVSVKDGAHFL